MGRRQSKGDILWYEVPSSELPTPQIEKQGEDAVGMRAVHMGVDATALSISVLGRRCTRDLRAKRGLLGSGGGKRWQRGLWESGRPRCGNSGEGGADCNEKLSRAAFKGRSQKT